jgi:hypothetical protein
MKDEIYVVASRHSCSLAAKQSHGKRGLLRATALAMTWLSFFIHFSKVFHQQTMDEDIPTADAAQEDQANTVVEEGDEFPREKISDVYNKT